MSRHTWNFSHQKQEQQIVEEEEENRYPRGHVHNQQDRNHLDPMYALTILATSVTFFYNFSCFRLI